MANKRVRLPFSEEKILEFVLHRRQASRDGRARQKFIDNFPVYQRAYKGEFKIKMPKQYSQYFVRMAYWTVDTIMAYFYEALFNTYPLAKFVGRKADDDEEGYAMQHVMDYEIYRTNFIDRVLSALNWVLKYGVTVTYD